jgi:hypothetical protein
MRPILDSQKVFGIGLSKTGTTSLTAALEILGIPTIHNPHDGRTQRELQSGRPQLTILEEYRAVTDIPVAPYYAQLDHLYPESKFILTVRDIDSWVESARNHWRLIPSWEADPFYGFLHAAVYGCLEFDEERFRWAYETHVQNVERYFSGRPEDLLIMDIVGGEGWEVLCPFLGIEVPEVPFPHRNTAAETAAWGGRLKQTLEELEEVVPEQASLILVDEQEFGRLLVGKRRPLPFLERNGEWWGRPATATDAVAELERMRAEGAGYIAFVWPAFWWLEYYSELRRHLQVGYPCILRNDRLVVFRLASEA